MFVPMGPIYNESALQIASGIDLAPYRRQAIISAKADKETDAYVSPDPFAFWKIWADHGSGLRCEEIKTRLTKGRRPTVHFL